MQKESISNAAGSLKSRIYFVDYLRAAVISLVVLHHTAITYGAIGSWYYTEPATDSLSSGLLSLFTNFNQAWFMGVLFLLSGYFTPVSYDHKGSRQFFRDRLIRLGIPLLVFFFILNPITVYIAALHSTTSELAQEGIAYPVVLNYHFYVTNLGMGPLWFVELLLFFDVGYSLWRIAGKERKPKEDAPFPGYGRILGFILVLAFSAYLLRIIIPINASVLGFPSLFDMPQYLSFFIIGTIASRGNWLMKMPYSMGRSMFIAALIASATLLVLSIVGTKITSLGWGTLYGYGTLSSAFYALWDSFFAVGASMFAIGFFRKHFNSRGKLWKYFSEHFYTVYIIQAPIITTVGAFLLYPVHIESLLKFFLAGVIVVPLIWIASYPVRKIPYADRVI